MSIVLADARPGNRHRDRRHHLVEIHRRLHEAPPLGDHRRRVCVRVLVLSIALREIPVSTAYAVWSGVGTATIAVIGIAFLGEPDSALKTLGIALIIVGVVVLNVAGNGN